MELAVRGSISHCRRGAVHSDAGDGALAETDGRAAVAGDKTAEELEEVGVVADDQYAFTIGILI